MEAEWIEDGHKIVFELDADLLHVKRVLCPFEDVTGAICKKRRDFCVVSRFIGVYGPEVNVGKVDINGPVEIAWVGVHGDSDLDEEFAGIWVTPIEDANFQAYKEENPPPEIG
ncbi:MAG: hypothetical protein ACWGQW_04865 [bacterium]